MEGITLTVSQLNDYVRRLLASDPIVQHITLRGEISNFKPYASGHWYFTLKDDTGRIDCALFRQYTYGVPFMPQDGMRVLVKGSAGLYVQGGKFQFYADGMTQDGVGDLYRRYLELKERLTAEGLFDASRKRLLPLLPPETSGMLSGLLPGIAPIASVEFRRIEQAVCVSGAVIAFALDEGFVNGCPSASFFELEAELKHGSAETLRSVCARLAEKYALSPVETSKLRRALDHRALANP